MDVLQSIVVLIFVLLNLYTVLCVISLGRPVFTGPYASLVGSIETFVCQLPEPPENTTILYTLFRENDMKQYGEFTAPGNNVPGSFLRVVKQEDEGVYKCKASVQNNTAVEASYSDSLYFKVIVPVGNVTLYSDPGSTEVFEGQDLVLSCKASKGTHLWYEWCFNGKQIEEWSSHREMIQGAKHHNSGMYSCVGKNKLNDTMIFSSNKAEILIKLKVPVSKPHISLVVERINGFHKAVVTCSSTGGTPPFTFTLYNESSGRTDFASEKLHSASFPMPITLGVNMGSVYCEADNGGQRRLSDNLNLTVVPVGGSVNLSPHYNVGNNYEVVGVVLNCEVEHGTFPSFSWLHNGSLLNSEADGYRLSNGGQVLSVTSINPITRGFYQCIVTDTFDNSSNVTSIAFLVDEEALNHVPIELVAVVFGCFLFLVCLVTGCCIYTAINDSRKSSTNPVVSWSVSEIEPMSPEEEDPVEEDYVEDPTKDWMTADSMDDQDEVHLDSEEE